MKTNYQIRYASNPADAKSYDTDRLRKRVFNRNVVCKE